MRMYSKIHKCEVETIGIVSGLDILCVTDAGQFVHGHPDNLVPVAKAKPDMTITVGHVIDNPNFYFDGWFEITQTDDDGTVHTLYDSYADLPEHVPVELLIEPITYMIVNKEKGRLRIEVR